MAYVELKDYSTGNYFPQAGNPVTHAPYVETQANGHSQTVTITRPADTTPYTANDAMGDTNGSAILSFAGLAKTGGR